MNAGEDDEALLAARQTQNRRRRAEFNELYRAHARVIYGYLHQKTMCPEVAADLTSETFALALKHLDRWDGQRGSGPQWLFGIATNLWRMWARTGEAEGRARRRLAVTTPMLFYADFDEIDRNLASMTPELMQAIDDLAPGDREIFQLRVVEGRDYPEIAAQLGCAEGTARTRASRAVAKLRQRISESVPDIDERLA